MKTSLQIFLFVFLTLFVPDVLAQKEKNKTNNPENKSTTAKGPIIYTYLGRSDMKGGPISKHVFDSLLKQGIRSRNVSGQQYKIERFTFTYGERNLFEDSIGNLKVMVDYLSEPCFGDTITSSISGSIYERTKKGDTVYFDNIIVSRTDSTTTLSKSMKFTITQ